ncbi:uncharacterized protein [Mytilus edulis]|uniref:uncharacterized protein n=1 Tax=Mytilus edulis TaxID=6550 RepID=UPI0039F09A15
MPHRDQKHLNELQKSLEKARTNGNTNVILTGDFNCPDIIWDTATAHGPDREIQQGLVEIAETYNLTQIHTIPTREGNILDLVFVTNPTLVKSSNNVPGISDHDIIITDLETKVHHQKSLPRKCYIYKKAKWDQITTDLKHTLEEVKEKHHQGAEVHQLWDTFKSQLQKTMNTNISNKEIRSRNNIPWIKHKQRKMLKKKQRLYKQARKTNIWSNYRYFQKECKKQLRKAEYEYVNQNIFEGLNNNDTCRHILKHLEKNKILTNLNHGFRSGYSCETQLITTINDFLQEHDKGHQIDVGILDFSKAFDTVPHNKLLHKLDQYGIKGNSHKWLKNFLTARSMRTIVEGESSGETTVDSGVPQGTVLGPILFLCHINDLPDSVTSSVRLFADDCLLYRTIKNSQDQQKLQTDLEQLEIWADKWGMRFNAKKCYVLSINKKADKFYTLNKHILQEVQVNPYLGLQISNDLKWSFHINNISKKANATLGFLRRNLRNVPEACRKVAYISLVRSTMEYGATIWNPYMKGDIDKLERIQNRGLRFIKKNYRSRETGSITNMRRQLEMETLEERRHSLRLILIYKVVEELARKMRCKYQFDDESNEFIPHPFQQKTGYNPSLANVAIEDYIFATKIEIGKLNIKKSNQKCPLKKK